MADHPDLFRGEPAHVKAFRHELAILMEKYDVGLTTYREDPTDVYIVERGYPEDGYELPAAPGDRPVLDTAAFAEHL